MKNILKGLFTAAVGAAAGFSIANYIHKEPDNILQFRANKFRGYYTLLNQWMKLKQMNISLDTYFVQNHYKTIAIYGMGELGRRLYKELENSNVKVAYCIDKNSGYSEDDIRILGIHDTMEPVDAVIVTATYAYDSVVAEISPKFDCPILSLNEVIFTIDEQ